MIEHNTYTIKSDKYKNSIFPKLILYLHNREKLSRTKENRENQQTGVKNRRPIPSNSVKVEADFPPNMKVNAEVTFTETSRNFKREKRRGVKSRNWIWRSRNPIFIKLIGKNI